MRSRTVRCLWIFRTRVTLRATMSVSVRPRIPRLCVSPPLRLQGAAQRINRVPNEQDRAVLNAPRNAGDHKMEALLKSSYGQQR